MFLRSLLLMGVLLAGVMLQADDAPARPKMKYTISKETTYVLGPVLPNGCIDYVAALNERSRQSVTPENNAMVVLVQAIGPRPDRQNVPASYFQQLGCTVPGETDNYFIQPMHYMKEKLGKDYSAEIDAEFDLCRMQPWQASKHPHVAAWLLRIEKPLKLVTEASRRTRYFEPGYVSSKADYPGLFSCNRPYEMTVHRCNAALITRAMLLLNQNKLEQAMQDLLTVRRMAELVSQAPTLIELLMSLAAESIANDAMLHLLAHPQLTQAQVQELQKQLTAIPTRATFASKMDLGERFNFLDGMMLVGTQGLPFLEMLAGGTAKPSAMMSVVDALFFRNISWDPALKAGNEWMDRLVAVLSISDPVARRRATEVMIQEIQASRDAIVNDMMKYARERGGKIETRSLVFYDLLRCLITPAALKVQTAVDKNDAKQRLMVIALALAHFKCDQQRYPATLEELSPRYLPVVPSDLFTGMPHRYVRTAIGYQLYSVGPNGEDDGGKKENTNNLDFDVVPRLPPIKVGERMKDDILVEIPPEEVKQ